MDFYSTQTSTGVSGGEDLLSTEIDGLRSTSMVERPFSTLTGALDDTRPLDGRIHGQFTIVS